MIGVAIVAVAIAAMAVASYTDIRIREVSNWLSFGLIFALLGMKAFEAFYYSDMSILWSSLAFGGLFLGLGLLFFYSGQWGGADVKLLCAMGVGFSTVPRGFAPLYSSVWPYSFTLIFNFFLVAVLYAMGYAAVLAVTTPKVGRDFRASVNRYEVLAGALAIVALFGLSSLYPIMLWLAAVPVLWFLSKFLRSVEANCMTRKIKASELREFDIPKVNIVLDGEVLVNSKDPNGMTPEQIRKVQRLVKKGTLPKKLEVKWGIPLIPVYPIAILVSVFIGDLLFAVITRFLI